MKFLKRFCLFAVLALLAASPASAVLTPNYVAPHNHSSAAQGGGALVPSSVVVIGASSRTKACASGYTRITPNFCKLNSAYVQTLVLITSVNVCTQSTALSGVTDAKGVLVSVNLTHVSGNAVSLRTASINLYRPGDSGCVTNVITSRIEFYEFTATSLNSTIGFSIAGVYAIESGPSGMFYGSNTTAIGAGSQAHYVRVHGYFD